MPGDHVNKHRWQNGPDSTCQGITKAQKLKTTPKKVTNTFTTNSIWILQFMIIKALKISCFRELWKFIKLTSHKLCHCTNINLQCLY